MAQTSSHPATDALAPALPIVFQNYKPRDESLKKYVDDAVDPETVVAEVAQRQNEIIEAHIRLYDDPRQDTANLAPKKVNWDLKRNVAERLERLERRTQRAMMEVVRRRAEEEGAGAAAAASATAAVAATSA
mmetsp:Transcript_15906/g.42741  ORF Transcript_15906/g.42741 Transcript_15906/m.42741 type:complete len:132 (-) Transcript_15906:14-409(-)